MIIKNKGSILELDVPMYKDTHFSTLYLRGNELIKVYDDSKAPSYERISERVFNNLTSINSEAFLNLRKCYSAKVQLMEEYPEDVVTAYTYDYIKSIDNKMIDMPMDYTIETLYRFRELVELLNLRRIEIRDAHAKNVVRTENGLVIIDPDRYISSPDSSLTPISVSLKEILDSSLDDSSILDFSIAQLANLISFLYSQQYIQRLLLIIHQIGHNFLV